MFQIILEELSIEWFYASIVFACMLGILALLSSKYQEKRRMEFIKDAVLVRARVTSYRVLHEGEPGLPGVVYAYQVNGEEFIGESDALYGEKQGDELLIYAWLNNPEVSCPANLVKYAMWAQQGQGKLPVIVHFISCVGLVVLLVLWILFLHAKW